MSQYPVSFIGIQGLSQEVAKRMASGKFSPIVGNSGKNKIKQTKHGSSELCEMVAVDYGTINKDPVYLQWKAACRFMNHPDEMNVLMWARETDKSVTEVKNSRTFMGVHSLKFNGIYDNIYDIKIIGSAPITVKTSTTMLYEGEPQNFHCEWIPTSLILQSVTITSREKFAASWIQSVISNDVRSQRANFCHMIKISGNPFKISDGQIRL